MYNTDSFEQASQYVTDSIYGWIHEDNFYWLGKIGDEGKIGFVGKLSEASQECERMTEESGHLVIVKSVHPLVTCPHCKAKVPDFELEHNTECETCSQIRADVAAEYFMIGEKDE